MKVHGTWLHISRCTPFETKNFHHDLYHKISRYWTLVIKLYILQEIFSVDCNYLYHNSISLYIDDLYILCVSKLTFYQISILGVWIWLLFKWCYYTRFLCKSLDYLGFVIVNFVSIVTCYNTLSTMKKTNILNVGLINYKIQSKWDININTIYIYASSFLIWYYLISVWAMRLFSMGSTCSSSQAC